MRRILPHSLRTRVLVALFVLACLLLPTNPPPAHAAAPAAIRTVGTGCTYSTLQAAVNAAASGDDIRIVGGTAFNGQTVISNKNLTISGGWNQGCTAQVSGSQTVLNGAGAGSVIEVSGNVTVLMTDLAIINGGDDADDGGGIEIDNAIVTLANVYVAGNVSDYGGGVHLNNGHLLLTNGTRIYNNTANQSGGGIYATGSGTVTLQTGTLVGYFSDSQNGNSATNGGGIFVANAGLTTMLVTLNGTAAVSENHATGLVGLGGGIYMQGGRLNMTSAALISDNSAYAGGGIQANNGAQVVVAGTLRNNSALGRGGGIGVSGATTALQLNAPTIAGNSAGLEGGGIASNATPVTFTGGTLGGMLAEDGNTAGTNGGGLYCVSAQCLLTDVLVSQNSADSGGGLYQSGNTLQVSGTARVRANRATSGNGGGIAGVDNAFVAVFGAAEIGGALPADGNTATLYGGGIYNNGFPNGSTLVAGNALVAHNSGWRGGGVGLENGSAIFTDSARISHNSASESGGGIFGSGPNIDLDFNTAIAANTATVGGGGVFMTFGTLDLRTNAQIGGASADEGNYGGQFGGGIWVNATPVTLGDNSRVRFNHSDQHGGGIALQGSAKVTTTGGQIADNSAAGNGGGIFANSANEEIRLTNTALLRNSAAEGGGIFSAGLIDLKSSADGQDGCDAQMLPQHTYCAELRANTTTGSGAAIYGYDSANLRLSGVALLDHATGLATVYLNGAGVTATLNDTLFADNPAGGYRSLLGGNHSWSNLTFAHNGSQPFVLAGNGGTLNVTNTIVWGNTLNGSTGTYVVSGGCNRSQGIVLPGFGGNPQFHTSPRGDYRLSVHSPAVDTCTSGTAVDLDGTPRPQLVDGPHQFDQGAFELVQVPTAVTLRGAAADLTNLADLSNLVGVALLLGGVTLLLRRRRA